MSGGDGEKVTPVPIPNTEVKLLSADGSWGFPPVRVGRRRAGCILHPFLRYGSCIQVGKISIFRSSSVVEHSAVNRAVVGSNPTCGANLESCPRGRRSTIGNRVDGQRCLKGSNPLLSAIETYLNGPLVKRLRHRPFTAVTRVRIP